jgi:hypothetical protein
LLEGTKLDASIDGVFGVLQRPFGTGKILGGEELLGVIPELLVAEDSSDLRKSGAESWASFRHDGLEVGLEQFPGCGLYIRSELLKGPNR